MRPLATETRTQPSVAEVLEGSNVNQRRGHENKRVDVVWLDVGLLREWKAHPMDR